MRGYHPRLAIAALLALILTPSWVLGQSMVRRDAGSAPRAVPTRVAQPARNTRVAQVEYEEDEEEVAEPERPVRRRPQARPARYQAAEAEPLPSPQRVMPTPSRRYVQGPEFAPPMGPEMVFSDDGFGGPGVPGGCGPGGCGGGCGGGCCQQGCARVYGRVEYLLWRTSGDSLPALATTSTTGTARAAAGVLGQPGTSVLFGNGNVNNDWRSGVRAGLGIGITPCLAIEMDYLKLGNEVTSFSQTGANTAILARPFLNARTNVEDANVLTFPAALSGSLDIVATSSFEAAGIYARIPMCDLCGACGPVGQVDFIGGYRYARLMDTITFNSALVSIGGTAVPLNTTQRVTESFDNSNIFHGADLGFISTFRNECYSLEFLGKIALGGVERITVIEGNTVTTVPNNASTTTAGGLLAQPTNIGTHRSNSFAVLPEVGIKLGYQIRPCLQTTFGYNVVWLNNVVRNGNAIDRTVNLSQAGGGTLVGAARPTYSPTTDTFWAQGFSFGVQYNY